ncbi:hypothetical protein TIFTF001_047268 [Ficus carica]|uniref:Uncharacterized protein n=1 Tax=Ficus carica TaxID=3494 RepID=A0AA87ZB19_FICCA|nr:hypothetical protein TIFTF001_047268 [Ficus carica]
MYINKTASHGWWSIEENIEWDRLRAPQVGTPPYMLHVSDCLNDGDHIEIQWTSYKEYPNDTIVVEFNQYPPGSTWRRTMISRKYHPKEGNGVDGFYGGIRKLSTDEEEIAKWLSNWQNQVMEEY